MGERGEEGRVRVRGGGGGMARTAAEACRHLSHCSRDVHMGVRLVKVPQVELSLRDAIALSNWLVESG